MMTRAGGDMYDWIGETRNPLGGACVHACPYCYVRRMRSPQALAKYSGPPALVEREVGRSVRGGRSVFVCSCNDLFAAGVPGSAVGRILGWASRQARLREGLVFVFQTKNPRGYLPWLRYMPRGAVLGVTIESDEWLGGFMGNAPSPSARALAFAEVPSNFRRFDCGPRRMPEVAKREYQDGPVNGSHPIRAETNRASGASGPRR